ncbi:hypothetical protein EV421DRAFT_487912 [Armillaria borealis]|uniref:Uncharacterized protein n=1 Tax=Armillaria borealis TaxID=47425 RepID=A0AA39MRL0_9AGAR|nr:hypothetical protein EV421DRAFT_487912 [Armillaria borealis]
MLGASTCPCVSLPLRMWICRCRVVDVPMGGERKGMFGNSFLFGTVILCPALHLLQVAESDFDSSERVLVFKVWNLLDLDFWHAFQWILFGGVEVRFTQLGSTLILALDTLVYSSLGCCNIWNRPSLRQLGIPRPVKSLRPSQKSGGLGRYPRVLVGPSMSVDMQRS